MASAALALLAGAATATLELTPENWQDAAGSRKVFVKFLAPW